MNHTITAEWNIWTFPNTKFTFLNCMMMGGSLSSAHYRMTSSYCMRINMTVFCSPSLKRSSSVCCTSVTRKKHGKSCLWSSTTCEQCFRHCDIYHVLYYIILRKGIKCICWSWNSNIQHFSLSDLSLRWRKGDGVRLYLLALDRSSFRWVRGTMQFWSRPIRASLSVLALVCLKTQVSLCRNFVFNKIS